MRPGAQCFALALLLCWTASALAVAGALNDPASVARQAGSPQHLEGREARGLLEEELDKELAAIYHTAAFLPDNFKLVDACPHLTFTVEAQSSQLYTFLETLDEAPVGHLARITVDLHGKPCGPFLEAATYYLRSHTSDWKVFNSIYVHWEFSFLTRVYEGHVPPLRILDLGGNCGLASRYMSQLYPKAKIVSVEPYGPNFGIHRLNTGHVHNIFTEQAAVAAENGVQKITFKKDDDWAVHVGPINSTWDAHPGATFPAVTLEYLLEKYGWQARVDYLKVDVEGAERRLCEQISAGASWIHHIRCISMETHDRYMKQIYGDEFMVSSACAHALLKAGFKLQFRLEQDNLQVWCR